MSMASTDKSQICGVHLVGSVCLPTAEDAFRAFCTNLPGRLRRVPDGEPTSRQTFVAWQLKLFQSLNEPRILHPLFNPNAPASLTDDEEREALQCFSGLETGYDPPALESYEIFKKLKTDGVIPPKIRFLVCLPTPVTVLAQFINPALIAKVEPLYEEAIVRSLNRIQEKIPHAELAIQWDLPVDFCLLENVPMYTPIDPWFQPVHEGIVTRLERLGDAVAADVELGYHFCYGDFDNKHFLEPKDAGMMAGLAKSVLQGQCSRSIDWIHMPVPKDRTDEAFFEPLQPLARLLKDTILYLGLVHHNDLEGTRKRIAVAQEFIPTFGVGTECGLARTPRERLDSIFEISTMVSDPVL